MPILLVLAQKLVELTIVLTLLSQAITPSPVLAQLPQNAPLQPPESILRELPTSTLIVQNLTRLEGKNEGLGFSADVAKLVNCESGGNARAIGDHGTSFGILQFKLSTFWRFGKKYGVFANDTTIEQARAFIYSPGTQIAIAEKMLDEGLYSQWYNCSKSSGLLK